MRTRSKGVEDVRLTRLLDAPPKRVWQAWSDPQTVKRWWGPDFFTCPDCSMDFRLGGVTVVCMHGPAGTEWDKDFFNTWTYTRIVPMQVIEFLQNPSDKDGNLVRPASIGLRDDFPTDVRTIVTLKSTGGKTVMTVTERGLPVGEMLAQAELGLNQTLDKLVAAVAGP